MACRRSDTGAGTAWADEGLEKDFPGPGENAIRKFAFRRVEQSIRWYDKDTRPGFIRDTIRWLCLPILMLRLAFDHL